MVLVEEGRGSVWLGCSVVGSRRGKGRDEMRWEEGGCGNGPVTMATLPLRRSPTALWPFDAVSEDVVISWISEADIAVEVWFCCCRCDFGTVTVDR